MHARSAVLVLALLLPAAASAQWTRVADVPADEVGAVLARGGTIYAGAPDAVYASRDGGATWVRSAPLPDSLDGVWALAEHGGRLFAGSYGGVVESADAGATWLRREDGLVGLGAQDLAALAVHAGHLYAGTIGSGVFRMDLAAANPVWRPFSEGLPFNVHAVFSADGGLVAGAGANGYVFLRDDGAPVWTERSFTPFDPNGPAMHAFAEVAGVLIGGGSHGFFRSTDRGSTWTRFNPGAGVFNDVSLTLDGPRVYALASRLVGGTYVYVSDDAGLTWRFVEQRRGSLTYDAAVVGGRLFAGGPDGLWVRPLAPTTADDGPAAPPEARLLLAGPDPFSASTRFAYELATPGDVVLAVFDLTGRRVATLAEGARPSGRHEVSWAPGGLARGPYVVRLTAGGRHVSRLVHRVK